MNLRLYSAIGSYVARFSLLDHSLSITLQAVAGQIGNEYIDRLLTKMAFNQRVDVLRDFVEISQIDSNQIREVKKICAELIEVNNRRNRIAHDLWLDVDGVTALRLDTRFRLDGPKSCPEAYSKLSSEAESITAHIFMLQRIRMWFIRAEDDPIRIDMRIFSQQHGEEHYQPSDTDDKH